MKRFLSVLMLLCMVFLLCACPGGSPVTPPAGEDCPTCGKNPCECPEDTPCPDCGKNPCECPDANVCPDCGKNPCECAPIDPSITFGEGIVISGAGDKLAAGAPCLTAKPYSEEGAVAKPAARFFAQVGYDGKTYKASGTGVAPLKSADGKTYGDDKKVTVLIVPNGAELALNTNVVLQNLVIVGDLTIASGNDYLFKNVQFVGNVTVEEDAKNVVFDGCRFSSLANAGTDTFLLNSCVAFTGVGVENSGRGLYVENSRFEGTGTAISSTGNSLEMRKCSITTSADGIGVELKDSQNSLVALSIIRGTQKSVVMTDVYNTAIVLNTVISVHATANKNIYIIDNAMGGRVESENNNYFIADGNTYPADELDHRPIKKNNENTNGDTITNVDARLAVGADPNLLPHTNKDLFVGMERTKYVKEYGVSKASAIYPYIKKMAENNDLVIIAPGVYEVEERLDLTEKHSNTKIYAYGVYAEAVEYEKSNYTQNHFYFNKTENLYVKGLTIGYAQQTCGQVHVLQKKSDSLVVVPGAGMVQGFGVSGHPYFNTTGIGIQREGTYYALGDFTATAVTLNKDGTMTVKLNKEAMEIVKKGDVLTCRLASGATSVQVTRTANINFVDMVTYGYAGGFMFNESSAQSATHYLRVHNTTRSGEIISESEYMQYADWQASYGVNLEISMDEMPDGSYRYRGTPYHIGSIDATHTSKNAEGSQVVSCIFENMCDDGTNQTAAHARLSDYKIKGNTVTLIYKGNLSAHNFGNYGVDANFSGYCADFRVGDRVFVYTAGGQLVCDGPATTVSSSYDSIKSNHPTVKQKDISRYQVTVDRKYFNEDALKGYDLTDDNHLAEEKVLVDNMSLNSNGFYFDNMVVRNVRSRGLLLKASDGTVKNCTFQNIAKVAVAIIYEIYWGESGVSKNITVEKNLIDHTSYSPSAPAIEDDSDSYKYCPIVIMGRGGSSLSDDFLLYKNIVINGNKLINRCLDLSNYAIYVRAAADVKITNNDFGESDIEDGLDVFCQGMYLNGALNVEISGNKFSPFVQSMADSGDYTRIITGDRYKNVFGTDVSIGGVSQIANKE